MDNKQPLIITQPRPIKKYMLAGSAFLAIVAGGYVFLLASAPALQHNPLLPTSKKIEVPAASQITNLPDRIYIPKAGISVPFMAGGDAALDEGLWHRYPERGDPVRGGNFILAGHRFEMGLTPAHTARKSPLYPINRVQAGDTIFVDFKGKRYEYKVTKRYAVKPTEVVIESPKKEAMLTLYTCTLKGEADGREVVEATLQ